MEQFLDNYKQAKIYSLKTETISEKEYIIAPVVMMVQGVHSGSRGPIYHDISELGKDVNKWNAIPVVINHPMLNGQYVSAHTEGVVHVGMTRNAKVEGKKLKAEVLLEKDILNEQSPLAFAFIAQGKPLEVSVGVYSNEEPVTGTYNGEAYKVKATNYTPDHLALLPEEEGACNWNDGCGIRVNKKSVTSHLTKEAYMNRAELSAEEWAQVLITNGIGVELNVNEESLRDIMNQLQNKIRALNSKDHYHYVEDVYPTYMIYSSETNEGAKLYKQGYAKNANGEVEFVGEPIQVRKQISYINFSTNKEVVMSTAKTPCCLAKVEQLIANKNTRFGVNDTAWLLEQPEEILDRLFPVENNPSPQVNTAEAIDVLKSTLKNPEDFISILPTEMQDSMRSGLILHKKHRAEMVAHITANSKQFTAEELDAMPTDLLSKISNSIESPKDYSGQAAVYTAKGQKVNEDEILYPAGVKME